MSVQRPKGGDLATRHLGSPQVDQWSESLSSTHGSAGGRLGVARCRIVEQNASSHDVRAAPDGDGILVSCTCGWRAWSFTSAAPASLLAAEQQIGGEHLAEVQSPIPPRGEVFWAFGIFVVLVCVTVVVVYLIWSW